jgi:hypothetical protein
MDARKIERSNRGLWRKANVTPGNGYPFHLSHPFLSNQDDVVYLHRVPTQLLDLNQPIYLL